MNRKKKPVPARTTRARVERTLEGIEAAAHLLRDRGGRSAPAQQLAELFGSVHHTTGPEPAAGTVLAELRDAAEALKAALATSDKYLIAVRAIELGEFRFWPGAAKHDAATAPMRRAFAKTNVERAAEADARILDDFNAWQCKVATQLSGLSTPERVARYLRVRRLEDHERRRLRALLRAGRVAPPAK